MNYVVIDLEMCKVPKMYRNKMYKYATEIIEIGTVLLNEDFRQIATLRQYVHPEYGVLDHYISNLTGIQNVQIKNAPLLEEALKHLTNWLGDREYKIFAWSECDFAQLRREIKSKQIEDEQIQNFMQPKRWIDYQDAFVKRSGFLFIFPLYLQTSRAVPGRPASVDTFTHMTNTIQALYKRE